MGHGLNKRLTALLALGLVWFADAFAHAQVGTKGGITTFALQNLTAQALNTQTTGAATNAMVVGTDSNPNIGLAGLGQITSLDYTPSVTKPGAAARAATFGSRRPASKPFSNIIQSPTVSPYLNLFREDLGGFSGDLNYQTLVRPQLQQIQFNQDLQRQQQSINRRVSQAAAQGAFNPAGSQQQMPTGHTTVFRNYSHYYSRR